MRAIGATRPTGALYDKNINDKGKYDHAKTWLVYMLWQQILS